MCFTGANKWGWVKVELCCSSCGSPSWWSQACLGYIHWARLVLLTQHDPVHTVGLLLTASQFLNNEKYMHIYICKMKIVLVFHNFQTGICVSFLWSRDFPLAIQNHQNHLNHATIFRKSGNLLFKIRVWILTRVNICFVVLTAICRLS